MGASAEYDKPTIRMLQPRFQVAGNDKPNQV